MIHPDHFKKGDTVGVVTSSNPIVERHRPQLDNAEAYLDTLGLYDFRYCPNAIIPIGGRARLNADGQKIVISDDVLL